MNRRLSDYRLREIRSYHIAVTFGVFVVVVGTAIGLFQYFYDYSNSHKSETFSGEPRAVTEQTKQKPTAIIQTTPVSKNLAVPYAAQAPFGNWTVHEESCEEAALVMYHEYLKGEKTDVVLDNQVLDATYREIKSWQVSHYGSEPDLGMDALGKFARDYYSYNYQTLEANEINIKTAITESKPVIVPVMTHSLQNNMYGRYTVYHVLLIKGYDATGVITNDAGVGNGQNHHYDWNILWGAIDAQTTKMGQGRVMLTLSK